MTITEIALVWIALMLTVQTLGLSALTPGGPLVTLLLVALLVVVIVVIARQLPRRGA